MKKESKRRFGKNAFLTLVLSFILLSMNAFGQQNAGSTQRDFSKNELESFVKANEKVAVVQQEAEEKITQKIEEEGLTVERFNEILQAQQNPDSSTKPSAEELASFNQAAQMIIKENQTIEGKIAGLVEEEGIDLEKYNQILVAYQQDPAVKQEIDKLLDDN